MGKVKRCRKCGEVLSEDEVQAYQVWCVDCANEEHESLVFRFREVQP